MAALSEFELIERFFRRTAANVRVGIGDDAAIVAVSPGCELAVSVDMVSGRHFFADADPESLGPRPSR
jgi:thiamine-monophosphate kinase